MLLHNADIFLLQETNTLHPKTIRKLQTIYNMNVFENSGTDLARGVCILITEKMKNHVVLSKHFDDTGRTIQIDLNIDSTTLHIINIYAPNTPVERRTFYENILPQLSTQNTIIGGDFNCISDEQLDILRTDRLHLNNKSYRGKSPHILRDFLSQYNFIDKRYLVFQ